MFLIFIIFSIALVLCSSQQCGRNASAAMQEVISQLNQLKWMLKNNITETYQNESRSFDHVTGRGSKDYGLLYLIPLLVGTKTAGLTAAAFTVIKLFIVQAFVFSKLALLSLTYLVLKKLLQYNSVHVYKTVSNPSHFAFPDYLPSLQLDTAGTATDGPHNSDNTQYSTILQSGDSHAFLGSQFMGSSHQGESSGGFTPSSEFTGLGSHASPDLQGQFSIATQSKLVRPANETASKADDRIFRTHPILARKRNQYPSGLTHISGVLRQRMTQ